MAHTETILQLRELYPTALLRHCQADERQTWSVLILVGDRLMTLTPGDARREGIRAEYRTALQAWQEARQQLDRLLPGQPTWTGLP